MSPTPPSAVDVHTGTPRVAARRSSWLTSFLLLRGAVSTCALVGLLFVFGALSTPKAQEAGLDTSELRAPILCAMGAAIFDLVGVAGTLAFKKWGLYALVVSTAAGLFLRAHEGSALVHAANGLLLLGILSGVMAQWSSYE